MRAASPPSCDGDVSLVPETRSQKALEEQGCCGAAATFHWGVALRLHRVRAELQPPLRPHRPPAHPELCPGRDLLQRQLCPHPLRGDTFQVLPLWAGLQSQLLFCPTSGARVVGSIPGCGLGVIQGAAPGPGLRYKGVDKGVTAPGPLGYRQLDIVMPLAHIALPSHLLPTHTKRGLELCRGLQWVVLHPKAPLSSFPGTRIRCHLTHGHGTGVFSPFLVRGVCPFTAIVRALTFLSLCFVKCCVYLAMLYKL